MSILNVAITGFGIPTIGIPVLTGVFMTNRVREAYSNPYSSLPITLGFLALSVVGQMTAIKCDEQAARHFQMKEHGKCYLYSTFALAGRVVSIGASLYLLGCRPSGTAPEETDTAEGESFLTSANKMVEMTSRLFSDALLQPAQRGPTLLIASILSTSIAYTSVTAAASAGQTVLTNIKNGYYGHAVGNFLKSSALQITTMTTSMFAAITTVLFLAKKPL